MKPEPYAACISYIEEYKKDKGIFLVFDLGGGTFDVSILELRKEEQSANGKPVLAIKDLALEGDPHLGGEDFDNRLVKMCKDMILNDERF